MRYNAGMFREDYVVRQIAQAAAVLGHVLGLVDKQRYGEALTALDGAYQQFAGLTLGLVTALPAAELVALARWGEMLDIGKLVVLGDLLAAEAGVYAAQGEAGAAADCRLKALEVLLEVAGTGEQNRQAVAPRLRALEEALREVEVPEDLRGWVEAVLREAERSSSSPLAPGEGDHNK
jgi:hypothetical protein